MLCDQFEDPILRILLIAGIVTLIVGIANAEHWVAGLPEGLSIIAAVVMITLFTSTNDYMKAKQFQHLEEQVKETDIAVARGSVGVTKSINVWRELVVGDVILLEAGCRVPADCIVVESTDLVVDEIFYHDEVPTPKKKTVCTDENIDENPDVFLLS